MTEEPEVDIRNASIFERQTIASEQRAEVQSFVNDEERYREAFARSYGGKGAWKTQDVRPSIFLIFKICKLLT